MKHPSSNATPSFVPHGKDDGGVQVLDVPGLVELAWLPGAGHTTWVCEWPDPIRSECELILGVLRPRCSVEIYVPNLDHAGQPINARQFAEELRREIRSTTGGQTSFRSDEADFCPPGGAGLVEDTLVIKTLLPTVVNDAMRLWMVSLLLRFGLVADQDVVQVEIAAHGYWIHTGLLRPGVHESSNGTNDDPSSRRPRRVCSTAS
jgi:hypothetical protein